MKSRIAARNGQNATYLVLGSVHSNGDLLLGSIDYAHNLSRTVENTTYSTRAANIQAAAISIAQNMPISAVP